MPERKISYDKIQGKSQHGFVVKAPSWERLYVDSALALTDFLVPLDSIKDGQTKTLKVSGTSLKQLMENWLTAVLSLFRNDKFLSHRIVFEKFDGKTIQAKCFGEAYDRIRHGAPSDFVGIDGLPIEVGDGATPEPYFYVKVYFRESENTKVG